MQISDELAEKALDYLRDNSDLDAMKRAQRIYLEEYRKSLKALIMREHTEKPVSAQEREAYADTRYIEHLEAMKEAVYEDERARFMRISAGAKIEAWRTQGANHRAMKI